MKTRPQETETCESVIETLRKQKTKLTQIEFAVHCGVPHRTYQRWVTGKSVEGPSMKQLKSMCKLLGIEKIEELPDSFAPCFKTDRSVK